jgi:hypothetical protein
MIPAHYVWTQKVAALKDSFEEFHKLQSAFELYPKEVSQPEGEVSFQSLSWYEALIQKIEHCILVLEHSPNQILLFTDIDICIYQPEKLAKYVMQRFSNENLSFLAMQEYNYDRHNGGFIFVKSSGDMIEIYKKTAEILRFYVYNRSSILDKVKLYIKCRMWTLPYDDQTLMDKLVKKSGLNYAYIPGNIGCWGDESITNDTLFHHAVCTNTVHEKMELLINKHSEYLHPSQT